MNSLSGLVTLATPYSDRLLIWLAETTVVASAFAVLALVATRVRWLAPGPATRHAFWLLVLIKLVTPPLIHWPWSLASPLVATSPELVELEIPALPSIVITETEPNEPGVVEATISHLDVDVEPSPALSWSAWTFGIASVWVVGSVIRGLFQGVRLARFSRGLGQGEPAPDWIVEEAENVGSRLGVRVPPILVVSGLSTPLIWCLGRPVLLIPLDLLKTLEGDRWRAILTHELAHLRRGDHWVRRLELLAGLVWWWCPIYTGICRKLDFEAELAADAWAVWDSPADRLTYAESLIRIGTALPLAVPPTPALGVAGTGRSFERRLMMILKNQAERHVSMPSLLLAVSFAALALPSWTLASQAPDETTVKVSPVQPNPLPQVEVVVVDDPVVEVVIVDDENDDQKKTPARKTIKKKADKPDDKVKELDKKRQAMEVEIEAKFGPDSEFAKKMEAFGKEMEAKFGDGSEFAKKMEDLGKEMEAKFGPNSQFAKDMEKEFKSKKPKVKFEARVQSDQESKENAKPIEVKVMKRSADGQFHVETQPQTQAKKAQTKTQSKSSVRSKQARRIDAIQAAIDQLQAELKALKDESQKDEDEDDDQN